MAGVIKRTYERVSPITHIITIVVAVIYFIWSIVEIVYYKRWMKEFISEDYHKVLFIYFHTSCYLIIGFSVLELIYRISTEARKVIILLPCFLFICVVIAGSTVSLLYIVDLKPNITQECSTFHAEINTIESAKAVFCHQTCQCYLYRRDMGMLPNMTTTDSNAASSVLECPGWQTSDMDRRIANIEKDLGCSGWCTKQEIFYFSSNDYWYYSNTTGWQHRIRWVGEDCYSKVKKTIEHAFYRLPIALIVMMLMCYVIHAAVTLQMLRASISGE